MIPENTYFRDPNGRIYGPYTQSDFWILVKEKRISDMSALASSAIGPWYTLWEYLEIGETDKYYFLISAHEQPLGPFSADYLRVLNIQSNDILPSTPVSKDSDGPWKLISETKITLPRVPDLETGPTKASIDKPIAVKPSVEIPLSIRSNSLRIWVWVLLAATILGSLSGSGLFNPNRRTPDIGTIIVVLAISLMLNPIGWITVWVYRKYLDSKCCPRCGGGKAYPMPNKKYKCFICKTEYRTLD